jgi:hypothetical protein
MGLSDGGGGTGTNTKKGRTMSTPRFTVISSQDGGGELIQDEHFSGIQYTLCVSIPARKAPGLVAKGGGQGGGGGGPRRNRQLISNVGIA